MNSNLIVKRTLDVGLCLDILMTEDIWDAISEDGSTLEHLNVDVIKDRWLSVTVGDVVIGCVQFKGKTSNCYESHIHILKQYRKEHTLDAGQKILDWCIENFGGATLYAEVPMKCESVINFLEHFDFNKTGVIPDSYIKNGQKHDLIILTRGV